jgi:hypothetical protein
MRDSSHVSDRQQEQGTTVLPPGSLSVCTDGRSIDLDSDLRPPLRSSSHTLLNQQNASAN